MPIYEYQCRTCKKQFQRLIMKKDREDELVCPECGRTHLKKLISRVAYHLSENDRLESFYLNKPASDSFYMDSRNIGLSAKKRAQQMGLACLEVSLTHSREYAMATVIGIQERTTEDPRAARQWLLRRLEERGLL